MEMKQGLQLGKVVRALENFPAAVSCPLGCGVRDRNACDTQPMVLGPAPFPWMLHNWPSCHVFLAVTK